MLKNKIIKDSLILLVLWLLYGAIAIFFIQLPDFDWCNYHYYNAWAFLNDRINMDFMAANFRSYFSPFVDIPQYLLLNRLNNHPFLFIFIETFDSAFLLFMTYKISNFLLNIENKLEKSLCVFYILAYVFMAPIMCYMLDFSFNDMKIFSLVLLSFYVLIKNLYSAETLRRNRNIFISGLIIGFAFGLKYNVFVSLVALLLCIIFTHKRIKNVKTVLLSFCAGAAITFILTDAYWLFFLYKNFGNPFFPHFNNIFHSKFANSISMVVTDYSILRPENLFDFVFYPFFKTLHGFYASGTYDIRFAWAIITAFVLGGLGFVVKKKYPSGKSVSRIISDHNLKFIILFIILSFYINIVLFGVYRFIIPASSLFGLLMLCFIYYVIDIYCNVKKVNINKNYFIVFWCCFTLFCVYKFSSLSAWELYSFIKYPSVKGSKVYSHNDLHIEDGAYVFLMDCATSFSVVGQNKNAHYYGFVFPSKVIEEQEIKKRYAYFDTEFMLSDYLEKEITNIVSNSKNVYFIMKIFNYSRNQLLYDESIKYYYNNKNAKLYNCRMVGHSTFGHSDFIHSCQICQVKSE